MDIGEFFTGLGLCLYCIALLSLVRWYVKDDARMRRMATSRWRIDRRAARKRGLSQDESFYRFAVGTRRNVRWVFTPFLVVCAALSASLIVRSI